MKKFILFISFIFIFVGMTIAQNNSTITTDGDDNNANVTQTGQNDASIEQVTHQSIGEIVQEGLGNQATMIQKAGWPAGTHSVEETGYIEQLGNNNTATLRQFADEGMGNNLGTQYQTGNGNLAIAWQFTVNAVLDQEQIGDDNEAHSYQTGFNGYVEQYQNGIQNIAAVDEQGGGGWVVGNTAIQHQVGNWNKAEISQYGTGGAKSAQGNTAEIYQYGSDNWAGEGLYANGLFGILQEGNYNSAVVTQNDNVNWSEVLQYGDGNGADVTQNGGTGLYGSYGTYVNQSSVLQDGNNNSSIVSQTYIP